MLKEKVTFNVPKEKKFSEWYNRIIREADLIDDRYNVKGFIVHKPWSMIAFKEIYRMYEDALERRGHKPVLFPTVIPEENLRREEEHLEGFKAEVFWITHAADRRLEKRLALRPTSETAFYQMYALWIRSFSDLPLKLYQSCTVFRYETKATKPLLRGREFLWIEAHDAFSSQEEAMKQVEEDMEITEEVLHKKLGIPFIFFQRPQWDKFKGAIHTYAADCLMPDGNLNQIASTHYLGENFAKAFGIQFLDREGKRKYVHQTCYGPGIWRIMAALISIHGDNNGLIFPFSVAPVQIVIIPITATSEETSKDVKSQCHAVATRLKENGFRVELDMSEKTPGAKYYYWEMRGVPLRIEIGPIEVKGGYVTLFRRDTRTRRQVPIQQLEAEIKKEGEAILENLRERAEKWLQQSLKEVKSFEELRDAMEEHFGIFKAPFCSIEMDGEPCAQRIREATGAEVRGVRFGVDEKPDPDAKCIVCGRRAGIFAYIAMAY
ncbi:proline--tRNA ligase [Candidatus Bathyarchaeota archaeon]|nr:proline--tRNA ligase [Candidatus Bathyarchaeota archaeon]